MLETEPSIVIIILWNDIMICLKYYKRKVPLDILCSSLYFSMFFTRIQASNLRCVTKYRTKHCIQYAMTHFQVVTYMLGSCVFLSVLFGTGRVELRFSSLHVVATNPFEGLNNLCQGILFALLFELYTQGDIKLRSS